MKSLISLKPIKTLLLISILYLSCSPKNDFENTKRYLEFDKETYLANDSFELTIRIVPIEADQTIRLFKDLRNIEISFVSEAQQLEFNQKLTKKFIEFVPPQNQSELIDEFTISKDKPFEKKLLGTITASKNKIIIEIPELSISSEIDKSSLIQNPNVKVSGSCRSIHVMEAKSFKPNKIEILLP